MSTHSKLDKICVAIVVCSLLLTALFMNGEALGITKIVDEDAEQNSDSVYFTENDQNADWDTSDATTITLTGDGAEISGTGAYTNDGNVVITNAGYYVVSGSLTDGYLSVDAYDSSKVFILLRDADIHCSDNACIRVDQADKVFLTLAEGSQNTLTCGASYSEEALADGTDGAIFAHDDLTINGSGSLAVTAEYRHGIAANDDLVITGGTITVTAAADAIHANDSLRIKEASITVEAGDDGLVTSNEAENGYLYVESGTLQITAADDGIHTTGDITIAGGDLTLSTGDDGIHSDASVYIKDGIVLVKECYEGIEALIIDVSGGEITLYPQDDGFNANGNSNSQIGVGGMHGGPGGGMQAPPDMASADMTGGMQAPPDMASEDGNSQSASETVEEETYINISGGTITIINETGTDADGLDSNGDILISGGTIYVSLVGSGSNSAVDYASENGGVAEISGGTIIACGASSMAEAFDSTSTQASILYNTSTVTEAGTTLAIEDADGNTLLSWEVPFSFSSALVSCPQMETGGTYRIVIGDNEEEITLEEVSASYGDAQSSMFGGKMNWGGMSPRGGGGGGFGRNRGIMNSGSGSTGSDESSSTSGTDTETAADAGTSMKDMAGMSGEMPSEMPSDMAREGMTGGPMQ
ncbi:MAG: carbohydrate-binding domain-containing protein, partial [Eubacteriales bacterium]|nr:carbohydrate-binding domain-containing protein [Eubacteriales bacterium]